jgi:hypothetical protein
VRDLTATGANDYWSMPLSLAQGCLGVGPDVLLCLLACLQASASRGSADVGDYRFESVVEQTGQGV